MTAFPADELSGRPSYRMLPEPTIWSSAFWTGGESGRLLIHQCGACHRFFHPPAPVCFRCRASEVAPREVSGRATIAAFTIDRHPWFPGFEPPYVIAIIELEEDPTVRLTTNIVGCAPENVRIGQPVEVLFEHWDDVWVPVFRPVQP